MPAIIDKIVGVADKVEQRKEQLQYLDSIKKIKDPNINLDDYEEIPQQAVVSTQILVDMWNKLGRPETPFTENGAKLMNIIISIWEDGYPMQARMWYEERKQYQLNELSISQQVIRKTGRSLASYPLPIYNMMKKCFHGFDPAERDNAIKLVKKWPQFRMANKI